MKPKKSTPFFPRFSLALILAATAHAKTITWDGGYPTTGVWNNAQNWAGDVNFANNDDVVIGPVCKGNYIGTARTVKSLTYLNTCNASFNTSFSSTGNATTGVQLAFTFNSTNTGITIEADDLFAHTLGNTANSGAANVVLQGDLTVNHDGTKTYTIARPIIGAFALIKDGPGPMTIVGDSSYSGGTLIINGSIQGTTNDTMLGTGDVTMGGTGSTGAKFTTGRSPANNFIIDAPDSGTIIVGNNSTTSAPTYGGAFTLAGDLTLQTVASGTTGGLTLTGGITGTGNLTLDNQSGSTFITLSGSDVNPAGNLTVQGDGTNGTTISAAIGANVTGLTKTGTSTLTLGGSNFYSGPTAVTGSTLALGANNTLPATALTLDAATLNAASFTNTVGALDVTGAVTIDFATGGQLAFADSSAVDWTGGTLDLTGAVLSGFSLRFGTDSNGLTATQLGLISAAGFINFALDGDGYLTATNNNPPELTGSDIVDDQSGGPIGVNTPVTYTVTFNKDMDDTTVTAADFGNAGSSTVNFGSVTETTPGVFLVEVTPTSGGTLQLQVNATAVLKDTLNNNLDTTSAIVDDTTIVVDTTAPTLASSDFVDNKTGGPVATGNLVTFTVTFSEDMDASTVDAGDFGNAGTATFTIGAVTEISPGVFTVEATPISTGTLQLQVNATAALTDIFGNPLDTSSAIVEDTTIEVLGLEAYWDINGATAGAGGPFPDGTWNAGNMFWNVASDGTGATNAWGSGQTAIFAAGTDTADAIVTVDGTQELGGLTFEEGPVAISGGTALRLSKNATANVGAGLTATVGTPITNDASSRSLTKDGAGTLILSASNTYSGGTTITSGTLQLGGDSNGAVAGNIANDAALVVANPANQTIAGDISGTGSLTKTTGTILTLSGSNTFTGATTVEGGTLSLGSVDALSTTTALSLASGTLLRSTLNGAVVNAPITIDTDVTISAPVINPGNQTPMLLTLNGAISGTSNVTFTSSTTSNTVNTIVLNAASGYTGSTLFTTSGNTATQTFLRLGADNALPATTVLTIDGGVGAGTGRRIELDLNGFNQELAGLTNIERNLRVQRILNSSATPSTLTINNSSDYTYTGRLGNTGTNFGLTKSGAGVFTASGVNQYAGDTTVNEGVFSLGATNPNNNASTVTIADTGATLDLTFAGTDTVGKLFIGTTQMDAGEYGNLSSVLPVIGIAQITGDGTLTVTSGPGYASWAALNGAGPNLEDDHDGDGVQNGIEYFLGGPNGNTTGLTTLPGVTDTAGTLSVTWVKAADYAGVYGTDFVVETSTTLTGVWTPAILNPDPGFTVTIINDEVTFTFPSGTKDFARLSVTGP